MRLVVVGGHSRNIGKTAVAAAIIAGTRELGWTALKVTQYGHNLCSEDGRACECAPENPDHPFAINREESRDGRTDTSRFLTAGAAEAFWVRTPVGRLAEAMPAIRGLMEGKAYVIAESNSLLRFLRPDVYLVVLDGDTADFKASARENLDRADAFVQVEGRGSWEGVASSLIDRRLVFGVCRGSYSTKELMEFVRDRVRK
jgi:hypothetical protein